MRVVPLILLLSSVLPSTRATRHGLSDDAQHLCAVSQHNNPQINKRAVEVTKAKYDRWWTAAQIMTSQ